LPPIAVTAAGPLTSRRGSQNRRDSPRTGEGSIQSGIVGAFGWDSDLFFFFFVKYWLQHHVLSARLSSRYKSVVDLCRDSGNVQKPERPNTRAFPGPRIRSRRTPEHVRAGRRFCGDAKKTDGKTRHSPEAPLLPKTRRSAPHPAPSCHLYRTRTADQLQQADAAAAQPSRTTIRPDLSQPLSRPRDVRCANSPIHPSTVQSTLHSRPDFVPGAQEGYFMQSALIEIPNRDFQPANPRLPQHPTAQHGPDRSRSSLPDARSPLRAPSTSSDTQHPEGATPLCRLDAGHLDPALGRLSVAEANAEPGSPPAATRVTVAGHRISEYENAAVSSSPSRSGPRPALGFKVAPNSRSDGVQLVDFPNGSFVPWAGVDLLLSQTGR
jgi:hypothetical protein